MLSDQVVTKVTKEDEHPILDLCLTPADPVQGSLDSEDVLLEGRV